MPRDISLMRIILPAQIIANDDAMVVLHYLTLRTYNSAWNMPQKQTTLTVPRALSSHSPIRTRPAHVAHKLDVPKPKSPKFAVLFSGWGNSEVLGGYLGRVYRGVFEEDSKKYAAIRAA